MTKDNAMSLAKKITAGVLTLGMLVAGIVVAPKEADATDSVDLTDKVIYEEYEQTKIKEYWTTSSQKAPVKEGYVFGGWFQDASDENADNIEVLTSSTDGTTKSCVPITKSELTSGVPERAYAKFVPAQVLSVKAQNSAGITEESINNISQENPMYVRVLSSLDSSNYEKVGFDIYLGNWKKVYKDESTQTLTETSRIYDGIMVGAGEGNEQKASTAQEIFGGASKYVSVWQLTEIDTPANAGLIIYVRPYWITKDGTKVEGLAKYVHIEDDYKNYISIPVNILNKEDVAKVAAGAVNMTYTNTDGKDVALIFKGVEAGRLLPQMNATQSDNVIKMVGNAKTANTYNSDETLYANIRFQKPTDDTDVDVDFEMNMVQFCDWDENEVTIDEKWDVKYDVKETTSK